MNVTVTNRPVQPEDEPFLKRLFATIEHERLPLTLLDEAQAKRLVQMQFNGHEQHYESIECEKADTLLLVNEQPVGRMIVLQNREEIRLADLALMPEIRQRGLGTALIESLQVQARLSNRPLRLTVAKNVRARNLYRRLGFHKVEETETHLLLEWSHRRPPQN